jgi:hypothetical protein
MTFAMGEALAHLHYLWRRGAIVRSIGANRQVTFSVA